MKADEIRRLGASGQRNITEWIGSLDTWQAGLLREMCAQMAESNELTAKLIQLHSYSHERVAELDRRLCDAQIETEKFRQAYYKLAADVEESRARLWRPVKDDVQP